MKARWSTGRRWKNDVWYGLVRTLVAVCSRLPRRVAGRLGSWLGTLAFLSAPALRRTASKNAARLDRSLARRSFASMGRAALEVVSGIGRPDDLLSSVRFADTDRARLDDALAHGRGVVFLSAHLGAWELLAWALAASGYPATVVARESYDPRLTRLVRRLRRGRGVVPVFRGSRRAGRRVLRALRDGRMVGVLIDQDTRVPGVFVPFLGTPAWTARGPAEIALRTGAPVVAGACVRDGDGWRVVVRRVPVTRRGGDDVLENTARFSRAIEALVRAWPDQWVWMHDRWKTSPVPGRQPD